MPTLTIELRHVAGCWNRPDGSCGCAAYERLREALRELDHGTDDGVNVWPDAMVWVPEKAP
jgi:hypothetical protein